MAFDLIGYLKLNSDQFVNGMRRASDQAKRFADQTSAMGRDVKRDFGLLDKSIGSITMGQIGLTAAVAGTGYALKQSSDTAINFEASMSKVRAVAGASAAEFSQLESAAIKLGAETTFSASTVSSGMQVLASSGFKTNQILDAMPGVLSAAAASGEDFANVSDIMISAMSGFNMKAGDMGRIADVLAKAANSSSISIGDMGYTLKYVAPVAATARQSLESVAAAAAILGNAGIKGDTSGTSLRAGLLRLAAPPKEAAKALDALSVSATDTKGNFIPLGKIIDQLNKHMKGLSDAKKLNFAKDIFGVESAPAWIKLIDGGGAAFEKMKKEMDAAGGSAKEMADIMTNNTKGAIEQFKGSIESLQISALKPMLPLIKDVTQGLTSMISNATPEITAATSHISDELKSFFNSLKGDKEFQKLGWGDKIVTVMDKASTQFNAYMAGDGGKKFEAAIASMAAVGTKIGLAVGGAVVSGILKSIASDPITSMLFGAYVGGKVGGPMGALIGGGTALLATTADKMTKDLPADPKAFPHHPKNKVPVYQDVTKENWYNQRSVKKYANGGILTRPHVGMVAESGAEAIIPLSPSKRGRATNLYNEVGAKLGFGSGSGQVVNIDMGGVNITVQGAGKNAQQLAEEIAEPLVQIITRRSYQARYDLA